MHIHLKNRALLKISGTDSESFLQAQLSNDLKRLDQKSVQLSAYCQHQGKIIALFWIIRKEDSFFLSMPEDLIDKVKTRLEMFVIMSDVTIQDISKKYIQIGLINEIHSDAYSINNKQSLLIEESYIFNQEISANLNEWIKTCIDSEIPDIFLSSSEKFVPQMLNLDIDEIGVSFSKGCYPGQEVVARLHYLGEAKRRLFSFTSKSEMQVGDNLFCASSNAAKVRGDRYKGSGIVVNKVKYNSLFYCLATLDVDLLSSKITLNNEHGPILNKINHA